VQENPVKRKLQAGWTVIGLMRSSDMLALSDGWNLLAKDLRAAGKG
jgi:hypothetical protein